MRRVLCVTNIINAGTGHEFVIHFVHNNSLLTETVQVAPQEYFYPRASSLASQFTLIFLIRKLIIKIGHMIFQVL